MRGAATSDSSARSRVAFSSASGRKIIHTPARTKQAPRSDQADNRSPPRAQPIAIAPGGCSDLGGVGQYAINITSVSKCSAMPNVVYASNTVTGAVKGLTNAPVTP